MCGIAGFLDRSGEWSRDGLERAVTWMASTLRHRGPDDQGVWVDAEAGVALGHQRLSILDLSPEGHQPMESASGRYVVVFNGEIYNFREIRRELEADLRGLTWRGRSDTEMMLAAIERWGVHAAVSRFNGMFAIALWDRQERSLYLVRDRLGKKPLYYGWMGDSFLFGSELKALRAHPAFRAEVNRDALALYLRYGYVPAPHTIYRGVHKLCPGQYATIRLGQALEIGTYWNPLKIAEHGLSHTLPLRDDDAITELDALLRNAVALRMVADVPLGAFLSGGIDSSTVVALMQAQSSRPIKTFTIGFHIAGYNEAEAAKEVAKHLGTDHTELYVTPEETQDVIPLVPELYDEPFADSSQIPTYLVSKLARQKVTVSLSGDGGDELFAGYTRYNWAEQIWGAMRPVPIPVRQLASSFIRRIPAEQWDRIYNTVEKPLLPARWRQSLPGDKLHKLSGVLAARDQDSLYHRLVSLWKNPEKLVIDGTEPTELDTTRRLRDCIPGFPERMMFRDLTSYLPEDILVKVDRASMGVSLEARAPLLDHRIVEWAWQLPVSLKRRNGQGKWLLRQVLYQYVPAKLIERPKTGFGVPVDVWLRGPLREWAEELLAEDRLRREGFLRPEPVREVWEQHLHGRRNDQYRLWAVLMFQAWKEKWLAEC